TDENRSRENSPLGTLRENPHTRTGCTVTALAVRRPAETIYTRRARRSTVENASANTSRTAPPRKFPFTKRPTTATAYTAAMVNAILTIRVQDAALSKSRGRFIEVVFWFMPNSGVG